uniref:Uncharacterized protein LOC102807710 n=1 Tax=Saccoglossus kowalevskii TaxID=10224 RepID=A0ABM0LYY7_SACKO|nr:PREDICTED: uncharacterized protein LOC102807710 [Saccoglossus kowalevskii]
MNCITVECVLSFNIFIRNETLLGSFIKPPEISVPRPAVMRQRVEVKERSPAERNPAEVSLLQDSFVPRPRILGYSRIHTPTQPDFSFTGDTPIITKVRFPEQTVRQTVRKTRPVNDLLQSQYLSEDWINNL